MDVTDIDRQTDGWTDDGWTDRQCISIYIYGHGTALTLA